MRLRTYILGTVAILALMCAPAWAQQQVPNGGSTGGGGGGGTVDQGTGGSSAWKVTFGGTAQPVTVSSGTVTFTNTTLAVTNAGTFATQATLAAETTKVIGTVNIAAAQSLAITGSVAVTGTFWQTTQPVSVADGSDVTLGTKTDAKNIATDGTSVSVVSVLKEISAMAQAPASTPVTGPLTDTQLRASAVPISAATLPLPTLAATSTKQSDGTQKTQVVDGAGNVIGATSNALDINIKSGNPTTIIATQATGTNLHTVVDSAPTTAVTCANCSGTVTVSGTVTTTPPSNASTNVAQFGGTNVSTGTGTGGAGIPRVTVSSDSSIILAAGVAEIGNVKNSGTFAVQATPVTQADTFMLGGVNVKEINGVTPLMGTGIMGTGSPRVTIASDNDPLIVKQATAANLNMTEASAAAIKTDVDKIPSQGQALAAASMPVVLTAAQVTTLTPPAAITGFALESTQLTGNTSLASVKTNTDPLVTSGGGGYVRQDSTATIAKESGGNLATIVTNTTSIATAARQDTGNTSLGSIKTDVDTLVTAGGGGYVRQDSTATMAKETGGNLASIASNTGTDASNTTTIAASTHLEDAAFVDQDRGMALLGVRQDNAGTQVSTNGDYEMLQLFQGWLRSVVGVQDATSGTIVPLQSQGGLLQVQQMIAAQPRTLLLPCNQLRRKNCQ